MNQPETCYVADGREIHFFVGQATAICQCGKSTRTTRPSVSAPPGDFVPPGLTPEPTGTSVNPEGETFVPPGLGPPIPPMVP